MNTLLIVALGITFVLGLPLTTLVFAVALDSVVEGAVRVIARHTGHTGHGGFVTPNHA